MRHSIRLWLLLIGGLAFVVLGLILSAPGAPVHAQDNLEDADYVGARECASCHRDIARPHEDSPHALALQDVERRKDGILADFDQGEDLRMVQFPGEDEARPFTADDIVFAIGMGRYAQRYLYELDRNEYAVFPAEWNTVTQSWQPFKLAESWPDPAYDWLQNCAGCHTTGLDARRGRWEDDGVMCEACHGPGSVHVELAQDAGRRPNDEERAEIHAAIILSPDAQICGQCHSRGVEPDENRPYPIQYRPGAPLLQDNVFTLAAQDDPVHWWADGHGRQNNMQFNEWFRSAHATALDTMKDSDRAEDGCVTCHSGDYAFTERIRALYDSGDLEGTPPEATTLATAQFSITCTTCHSQHHATQEVFNLVDEPNTLCASCHQNTDLIAPVHHPTREMFEGQPVIASVEGIPSVHFAQEDGPRCVTCHMPDVPVDTFSLASHTWRPILPVVGEDTPPNTCSGCHDDLTTADLQSLVQDTQASVRQRLSVAWARLASVQQPEAGTEAAQIYDQVVTALTFVQNDGSQGIHNYAYTDALLDETAAMLSRLSVPGANLQPTEAPAPTATPSEPQLITVVAERHVTTGVRPMTIILGAVVALILLIGAVVFYRQSRRRQGA